MPHKNPEKRKEYAQQYNREWYKKNKEEQKNKVRDRERLIFEWFQNLKSQLVCTQCHERHIACLEFHHLDPSKKERAISIMINNGWSQENVKKEIDKCIVLCSNCHKKIHWEKRFLDC